MACITKKREQIDELGDAVFFWYFFIYGFDFAIWILQPLVIVLFKKNQDMFCCFSKVHDMTSITLFQAHIDTTSEATEDGHSSNRGTIKVKEFVRSREKLI